MQRTVEPELMEDAAQAHAYALADFSDTDEALIQRFLATWGTDLSGEIADLGCGPGNIALRLAPHLPQCTFLGVDGSAAMLEFARSRAGDRVRFRQSTLPDPTLPAAHFQAVISNSLLHHLHDPQVLWQTIRQIAAPSAVIFVADLRRPPTPAAARALLHRLPPDAPAVLRQDFLASLHAAFTVEEVQAQVAGTGLQVEALGDRHLLVFGRL